jgi:uncharacterized protein (DUF1778 family)
MSNETKTARLEARMTPGVHELLKRAAALVGRSVSDFVVSAAQESAQQTIAEHELLQLSRADQERFAKALLNPQPVSPALERAAQDHDRLIKPS